MAADWIAGAVAANRRWTDQLYSLRIDAPGVRFDAGQFARLALDLDGERVARPYSFVNAPDAPLLEFYSIVVEEGPLSARLQALEPGDPIWVSARGAGFFVLAEVPASDCLWLLSTGTGIGPYLSMLATPEPWRRHRRVALVHAVRYARELTYRESIRRWQEEYPEQFRYVPMVSREAHPEALAGRIPAAIEDGRLAARAGMDFAPERAQVMLCGNPGMVRDTSARLKAMGLARNRRRAPGQITTESYW